MFWIRNGRTRVQGGGPTWQPAPLAALVSATITDVTGLDQDGTDVGLVLHTSRGSLAIADIGDDLWIAASPDDPRWELAGIVCCGEHVAYWIWERLRDTRERSIHNRAGPCCVRHRGTLVSTRPLLDVPVADSLPRPWSSICADPVGRTCGRDPRRAQPDYRPLPRLIWTIGGSRFRSRLHRIADRAP